MSAVGSVLDMAEVYEIIKASGSWLTYNDEKLGQGRENAKSFLRENPKIMRELEKRIREKAAAV